MPADKHRAGSEAIEAAMKLARQYHLEISPPQPQRTKFIARKESYHGTTLGSLSLGGHVSRRALFEPMLLENISRVSACNAYRGKADGEGDEEYVARLATELDEEFQRLGPDTVCAFVAEPVVGAVRFEHPPSPFSRLPLDEYSSMEEHEKENGSFGIASSMFPIPQSRMLCSRGISQNDENSTVIADRGCLGKCGTLFRAGVTRSRFDAPRPHFQLIQPVEVYHHHSCKSFLRPTKQSPCEDLIADKNAYRLSAASLPCPVTSRLSRPSAISTGRCSSWTRS